jgi:hypothetical protein
MGAVRRPQTGGQGGVYGDGPPPPPGHQFRRIPQGGLLTPAQGETLGGEPGGLIQRQTQSRSPVLTHSAISFRATSPGILPGGYAGQNIIQK